MEKKIKLEEIKIKTPSQVDDKKEKKKSKTPKGYTWVG